MAEFDYIPVNITSEQLVDVVSRGAVSDVLKNNEGLLTSGGAFSVIGDLSELETGAKENIVDAINEARRTGSGGGEGGIGKDGEDGGYYIPVVSQLSSNTIKMSFLASKEDMEDLEAEIIKLPNAVETYQETIYPYSTGLPYTINFEKIPSTITLEWNTYMSDTVNKASLSEGAPYWIFFDVYSVMVEWFGDTLTLSGFASDPDFYIKVVANNFGSSEVGGVGIASIEQTTTSTADDGDNIITVTLTDGSTSTFAVQNGSKGSSGDKGEAGYTPVRGIDYWTDADKAEMVADVLDAFSHETWTFTLADGTIVEKEVALL